MRKSVSLSFASAVVAAGLLVGACSDDSTSTASTAAPDTSTTLPHWTYEGEEGPAHWGELSAAYATCADGSAQTPINITSATTEALADPTFNYSAGTATVVNNGHTIQANAPEGNTVTVDGVSSPLKQIHFHAPSEHTIDGTTYAAEVHFVHKTDAGEITVVGVLIEEGPTANAAWQPYIDAMGVAKGAEQAAEIDWAAMLPTSKMTYRYTGSLTTPPCSEGVHWMLMETPVQLSAGQIAAIVAAYEGNARPVQSLNGRTVQMDSSEG